MVTTSSLTPRRTPRHHPVTASDIEELDPSVAQCKKFQFKPKRLPTPPEPESLEEHKMNHAMLNRMVGFDTPSHIVESQLEVDRPNRHRKMSMVEVFWLIDNGKCARIALLL
ncbi:hypothetical protein ACN47E_000991 [Coniothyrium glycines]